MRLFFALWPSQEIAGKLAEVAARTAKVVGGRLSRPETLHLTLDFLGEVPDNSLPELIEQTGSITASRFTLAIDKLGDWRHNRLVYAGCTESPAELLDCVAQLGQRLGQMGFSLANSVSPFVPHITLIRKTMKPLPTELTEMTPILWPCTRILLVRSVLSRKGAAYETLASIDLTAA